MFNYYKLKCVNHNWIVNVFTIYFTISETVKLIKVMSFDMPSISLDTKFSSLEHSTHRSQWRSQLDNWGGHIHIFVFCVINFFWNLLFLRSGNMNIWIWAPPPPINGAGYATDRSSSRLTKSGCCRNSFLKIVALRGGSRSGNLARKAFCTSVVFSFRLYCKTMKIRCPVELHHY